MFYVESFFAWLLTLYYFSASSGNNRASMKTNQTTQPGLILADMNHIFESTATFIIAYQNNNQDVRANGTDKLI